MPAPSKSWKRTPLAALPFLFLVAAPYSCPPHSGTAVPGRSPRGPGVLSRESRPGRGFTFSNPAYGVTPNGQTHTQDTLVTWNGWQYLAYWNADEYLTLARRELPSGPWETVVFTDAPFSYVTGEDSHNAVSVGVCPNDGTIHLAFDHHNTRLNYRRSVPGLATNPRTFAWSPASFGPVEHQLDPARGTLPQVTYPRFLVTPEGDLQFVYREFSAGNGNNRIVDYGAATGTWSNDHVFMDRTGPYDDPLGGHSDARYGYFNRIAYDSWGTLHATWTWRETVRDSDGNVDYRYNRDIAYAFSEDRGRTWYSATFDLVADQATGLVIRGDSPGVNVVRLGAEWGLMNDQAHVVDQRGRVHVVMYYKDQPDTVVSYGSWSDSHYVHWWGDADGVWRGFRLPVMGDRPKMVVDRRGRLFLTHTTAFRDFAVEMATPERDYLDWRRVFTRAGEFGSTAHVDRPLFRLTGVMSVPFQDQPATFGDDSAIRVLDFLPAALFPAPESFATTTLEPVADTYVRSGAYADDVHGADDRLLVKDDPNLDYDRRAFLRFDVSGLAGGPVVRKVYLEASSPVMGPLGQTTPFHVHFVADDQWDEATTTWNAQPALGPSLAAHFGRPSLRWDVTAEALAEAAGDGLLSIGLVSAREGGERILHLWSREATVAVRRPRLLVVYD